MTIPKFNLIPLELVSISGPIEEVFTNFKTRVESGELPRSAVRNVEYRRLTVLFDEIGDAGSLLDFGTGLGQLANAASVRGTFKSIIAADKKIHSSFVGYKGVKTAEFSLTAIPNPENRADVVVCREKLANLSPSNLRLALQNLQFLARKTLIVLLPYNVEPDDKGVKQQFTLSKIADLMPDGTISLMSEGPIIRTAMIRIDLA